MKILLLIIAVLVGVSVKAQQYKIVKYEPCCMGTDRGVVFLVKPGKKDTLRFPVSSYPQKIFGEILLEDKTCLLTVDSVIRSKSYTLTIIRH